MFHVLEATSNKPDHHLYVGKSHVLYIVITQNYMELKYVHGISWFSYGS